MERGNKTARLSSWPIGSVLRAGVVAGFIAATVELVPVLAIQSALGVSVGRVFQSIATGVLGAAAYRGGSATAVLGFGLHLTISLCAGLVLAGSAAARPALLKHPLSVSVAYGALVYLVMSYVVLPLSAVAFPRATAPAQIAMSVAVHIVAFALPIVLTVRRMLKTAL